MKKISIVKTVLSVIVVVLMTSCSFSAHPGGNPNFSLVIDSSPGLVISRHSDGRYFYRGPNGYTYWRGRDNRYYIDRSHIKRGGGGYDRGQYNTWKRGHKKYYR